MKKSPLSNHLTTQLCNFYIGPDDQQNFFKKSPLSMHHTTQLCNFYIGPDDQPKKIKKKKKCADLTNSPVYLPTTIVIIVID